MPINMKELEDSWLRAWLSAGVQPEAGLFGGLLGAYQEAHRHYHTLQHLRECIANLQPVLALAEDAATVELALWFHDAVYDPRRSDNELQSANWARQAILSAGASEVAAARVHALVLATRHSQLPVSEDERLLVDVDLAILGTGPERFAEYERQIRAEYAWVPDPVFRTARLAILRNFLARPLLYGTPHFQELLEAPARRNLCDSIARLEQPA